MLILDVLVSALQLRLNLVKQEVLRFGNVAAHHLDFVEKVFDVAARFHWNAKLSVLLLDEAKIGRLGPLD